MGTLNKKAFIEKFGEDAWAVESVKRNGYSKKYYETHKAEKQKKHLQYYYDNRDEILVKEREKYRETHPPKKIKTQEERVLSNREANKRYRANHPEYNKKCCRVYYRTKGGRALNLVHKYYQSDIEENRGPCTLTREWVVDHIFSSSCVYCGDSDWTHLGCDRIDNSLPHTPENCICACGICNIDRQLQGMSVEDFKKWRSENPRECDIKKVG